MRLTTSRLASLAVVLAGSLIGCGGDGDTPSLDETVQTLVPQAVAPGESIGVGVQATGDSIQSVSWRQVSGPSVVFHATRSKMIGFDVPSAADYAFEATVATATHGEVKRTVSFSARGARPQVNVRLDRAVPQLGSASLHAWHSFGDSAVVTYRWEQTAGPAVTLGTTNQALLLFDAPAVTSDTLLKFRATVTDSRGSVANDEAWVLVEATSIDKTAAFWSAADMVTGPIYAYRPNGPRAAALEECIYTNSLAAPCRFSRLPLIARETAAPTVSDIMNRVIVSHDWMGRRFEEFLASGDESGDMRRLLRPVTAVVIAADIRPSFYWAATGAIYLDPSDLWLSPDERDTVLETPDFRRDFDRDLAFAMPWRLVRDNNYASYYHDPEWRDSRMASEQRADLASLLSHELAHAADFFPPTRWASLTSLETPASSAEAGVSSSQGLGEIHPLSSQEMRGLAEVAFSGTTATAAQKAYLPVDVAGFFVPDDAADFYSYSAAAEDFAELFSFLMMRYRYGIDADIAVTNFPKGDSVTARDYLVTWGQRGRIGEKRLAPRLRFVAEHVLPELDVAAALASLPAPKLMRPGQDWVANLNLGGSGTFTLLPGSMVLRRPAAQPVRTLPRHMRHPRLWPRP